jgi:inorganic pyrophosphatase
MATPLNQLLAQNPDSGLLNVIVDTPKGSRNKYKYDEEHGLWRLSKVLPLGASFPYDFGFLPSTRGEDGDPVDVLVLLDEPRQTRFKCCENRGVASGRAETSRLACV